MLRFLSAGVIAAIAAYSAQAAACNTSLEAYRELVHARNPDAVMQQMQPHEYQRFMANVIGYAPWARMHLALATGAVFWEVPEARSVLVTLVRDGCVVIDDVFAPYELRALMIEAFAEPQHPPFRPQG